MAYEDRKCFGADPSCWKLACEKTQRKSKGTLALLGVSHGIRDEVLAVAAAAGAMINLRTHKPHKQPGQAFNLLLRLPAWLTIKHFTIVWGDLPALNTLVLWSARNGDGPVTTPNGELIELALELNPRYCDMQSQIREGRDDLQCFVQAFWKQQMVGTCLDFPGLSLIPTACYDHFFQPGTRQRSLHQIGRGHAVMGRLLCVHAIL